MSSGCRPAGPALWAVLSVFAVLAPPGDRSSCVALISPERRSSSTVEAGSNTVDEGSTPASGSSVPQSEEMRFSDSFFQCYADSKESALSCVGQGAREGLDSFFSKKDLHVTDGLSLVQEVTEGREVPPDILNPAFEGQHKSIIDSAASYLSARALRWDMSGLYPGLVMRVGPTLTGSGVLEFVLEPRRFYSDRALGPSRMVLKQVVLPFLLGLKVSVASLVPLLLFAIVFLAKKALLMSQLSALVSGLLGFGAYGHYGHGHAFAGAGLDGGQVGVGVGGAPLGNPLLPLRTSPQVFPHVQHPEEGPQILHLGSGINNGGLLGGLHGGLQGGVHGGLNGAVAAASSWPTTPHLFRKVNYDFRDERHASLSSPIVPRNTKGFRWEDEVADDRPRTAEGRSDGPSRLQSLG